MRYSKIDELECVNGNGIGVSVFVQGCNNYCNDCFNKETWDFNGGKEFTKEVENELYDLINRSYVKRVSVLGGEPLSYSNVCDVYNLICNINTRFPEKEIWLWTGYTIEEIFGDDDLEHIHEQQTRRAIALGVDYLIDGRFDSEQRDLTIPFRGSRNQRLLSSNDIYEYVFKGE